ncbi:MAG TPA: alpha/beta fold hydrolase [Thermoanaerobaculia bacterium]|jgi:phospholipase/carboxylesterase|nr:alpha/beta fold hydrolase [Thermoanaerobaculia bacterium]
MNLLYTAHVPAGDGPFPAVILLHGWGASAHDLLGLAPLLFDGQAVVLCPEGQVAVPFGGGQYGHGWFPLRPGEAPDVEAFRHAADALKEFVGTATASYPIDPRRIVVAGFSQGGMMAYHLALSDPSRFAGLIALSSWFPQELAEEVPKLPGQEGFPVLVLHGTRDDRIEVERARESREALRPYGVAMTYRELDMGHEVRQDALRIVLKWLQEKTLRQAG